MSCKRKSGCYSKKNATTNVGVLIIVVSGFRSRYGNMIVRSVCQDVIISTDISNESIVVIVAVRLLCHGSELYPGVKLSELCLNSSFRQWSNLRDTLMCHAVFTV